MCIAHALVWNRLYFKMNNTLLQFIQFSPYFVVIVYLVLF